MKTVRLLAAAASPLFLLFLLVDPSHAQYDAGLLDGISSVGVAVSTNEEAAGYGMSADNVEAQAELLLRQSDIPVYEFDGKPTGSPTDGVLHISLYAMEMDWAGEPATILYSVVVMLYQEVQGASSSQTTSAVTWWRRSLPLVEFRSGAREALKQEVDDAMTAFCNDFLTSNSDR